MVLPKLAGEKLKSFQSLLDGVLSLLFGKTEIITTSEVKCVLLWKDAMADIYKLNYSMFWIP